MPTKSETLFDDYCAARGYACEPIAESDEKTPDRDVRAGDVRLMVEVKELAPNDEDLRMIEELRTQRWTTRSDLPGRRASYLIKRASKQLGRYRELAAPCVLVAFDNRQVDGYRPSLVSPLEAGFIDYAMYGLHAVALAVPREGWAEPEVIGERRGGRRQMTPAERTHISAVSVLYEHPDDGKPYLWTFHNFFAAVPLPRSVFAGPHDRHFAKPNHPDRSPGGWIELRSRDD